MSSYAILLLAVSFAGLVFASVEDVSRREVAVWAILVLGMLGAMRACPGVLP